MIRIVIENIVLFFLPTAVYVTYVLLTRKPDSKQGVLDDAPLVYLMAAGTALIIIVLVAFGSTSGNNPGHIYIPPTLNKDGHIEPGVLK
jgi:hypothetical protein